MEQLKKLLKQRTESDLKSFNLATDANTVAFGKLEEILQTRDVELTKVCQDGAKTFAALHFFLKQTIAVCHRVKSAGAYLESNRIQDAVNVLYAAGQDLNLAVEKAADVLVPETI